MIGPVQTTHPKAGLRRSITSPQAPRSLEVVLEILRILPQPAVVQDAERDETQHGSPRRTQTSWTREGLTQTDEQAALQHLRRLVGCWLS